MVEPRNEILGWATADLIRLDGLAPGLIRRVVSAPPMVREAVHLVLALRAKLETDPGPLSEVDDEDRALAAILRAGRAGELLSHALGQPPPDGLLGALKRIDGPMKSARSYFSFFSFFENPALRPKAEALRHVGKITERMVMVANVLDDRCICAETLKRIESVREAVEFNRAVAYAQSVNSRITDEVVGTAITRLPADIPLGRMVRRWVRRADRFPPQPVIESNSLRPLSTSRDLIEAGYRYRDCLGSRGLEQALIGSVAFLEFQHLGQGAILELRPLTAQKGWVLWEVHVFRNGLVLDNLQQAARAACSAAGIPHVSDGADKGLDWTAYRRLTRLERGPFG